MRTVATKVSLSLLITESITLGSVGYSDGLHAMSSGSAQVNLLILRVEEPRYERDRSASPRPAKREDSYRGGRDRSASPNGRMNSR